LAGAPFAAAQDGANFEGPNACSECHKKEAEAWQESHHFKTFREMPRRKEGQEIGDRMGIRRINREGLCLNCHFTVQQYGPKSRNHPAQTRSNPQNTLDDLLQQGRTELISRINEQKACADVFGGREKALKALNQPKLKPGSLDNGGIMEIKGNNVTVYTSRFTESGQTLALALNISKSTVQGHPSTRYDLMSLKLSGKEFAAFAIGHELGHKRKIYGEYNNDGSSAFSNLEAGANNEKIRAACFSEFAPQPIR
jgi:hypothetical protein